MALPILKNPNKQLREVSRPITDAELASPEIQTLIDELIVSMNAERPGVGIAAPQVGKNVRIIIAETADEPTAYVNPKIISVSDRLVDSEEGCLSVPGVYGIVKRHKTVKVKAKDRFGNTVRFKTGGLLSIIFQHEIDHLDGILFIDKAEKIIQGESKSAI